MDPREVLAPRASERIVLVVLVWALLNVGLVRLLDSSLVRWEVLFSALVVFGWAVWAIGYRLEQSRKEWYRKQR